MYYTEKLICHIVCPFLAETIIKCMRLGIWLQFTLAQRGMYGKIYLTFEFYLL